MGIDLLGSRSGVLRQLVLDYPPPVVADMLGYSYQDPRHQEDLVPRAGSVPKANRLCPHPVA
jgi:hypothetical protein